MSMLSTIIRRITFLHSLGLALFALLLPVYAFVPNLIERALHIGLAMPLIFLANKKPSTGWRQALDIGLTVLGLFLCGYILVNFQEILEQYGVVTGSFQTVLGLLMVLSVLAAAARM